MRIPTFLFSQKAKEQIEQLVYDIGRYFKNLNTAINGRLTFGDGVDIDNIAGKWVTFTSNGSGGTETAIAHNLGVVPVGVMVMKPQAAGTMVRGATAWTVTHIYLTFSSASQTVTVFLVIPPQTS
jgi:hypothetical protein